MIKPFIQWLISSKFYAANYILVEFSMLNNFVIKIALFVKLALISTFLKSNALFVILKFHVDFVGEIMLSNLLKKKNIKMIKHVFHAFKNKWSNFCLNLSKKIIVKRKIYLKKLNHFLVKSSQPQHAIKEKGPFLMSWTLLLLQRLRELRHIRICIICWIWLKNLIVVLIDNKFV